MTTVKAGAHPMGDSNGWGRVRGMSALATLCLTLIAALIGLGVSYGVAVSKLDGLSTQNANLQLRVGNLEVQVNYMAGQLDAIARAVNAKPARASSSPMGLKP